jgi:hypothetical protein
MQHAGRMIDESFAAIERRIRACQGEQSFTRSGLPMTYAVEGDRIKVSRAKPWLSMEGAREIWAMGPSATLTEIDQRITGRAYLFAILRDPRIASVSAASSASSSASASASNRRVNMGPHVRSRRYTGEPS